MITIILQVIAIILAIKCLTMVNKHDIPNAAKFLNKFIKIMLIVLIISFVIGFILEFETLYQIEILPIIYIIKAAIEMFFIILIGYYSINLLKNLADDKIYDKTNPETLLNISKSFIYYALTSVVGGFAMTIISLLSNNIKLGFYISTSFFIFILLGVIFYILSLLFERSIDIYEENQLTI